MRNTKREVRLDKPLIVTLTCGHRFGAERRRRSWHCYADECRGVERLAKSVELNPNRARAMA